jgi:hypothetical protein
MTIRDKTPTAAPKVDYLPLANEIYSRALSVAMMAIGLWQWAVILGVVRGGGGMFEAMSASWQIATMHFAVIDLVAAVGLWQRVAWGNVVWIYAALSEIAVHTVFAGTFGVELLVVAFHVITLAGWVALTILARRGKTA